MNIFVVLAVLSLLGAAALFIALAVFLRAIDHELEDIGGPATRFVGAGELPVQDPPRRPRHRAADRGARRRR